MIQKRPVYILISAMLLLISYHFLGYIGHFGYDDMQYALLAHEWTEGVFNPDDHFSFRSTILAFTSVFYHFFGISDASSSWSSLIQGFGILILVYNLLKRHGRKTLIVGLGLCLLAPWFLFYSDKLMSDIYLALGFFGAIGSLYIYYFNKHPKKILLTFLLVTALAYGFMSKGTIVLILPLLLYFVIRDFFRKQHLAFWTYTFIFGLLFLTGYALLSKYFTGSYTYRFQAIAQNAYLNACSYNEQPIIVLMKRISYQFWELMIYQGLMVPFLVVIPYAFQKKFKFDGPLKFWMWTALILLLTCNFMSISLSSYSPMCLDPRHYLFLIPIGAITSALILQEIKVKGLHHPYYILFVSGVFVSSYFMQDSAFEYIYAPIFIAFVLSFIIKNEKVLLFIAGLALLVKPIQLISYAQDVDYNTQKGLFKTMLTQSDTSYIILTNTVQSRIGNYYHHFEKDHVQIMAYDNFNPEDHLNQKIYLFKNGYTQYLSGMTDADLPYFAQHVHPKNNSLFADSNLKIFAYEMSRFDAPEKVGTLIISDSLNRAENTSYWKIDLKDFSEDSLENYIQVKAFGPSFTLSLDAFEDSAFVALEILTQFECSNESKSTAQMVLVVQDEQDNYIWEGQGIQHLIKSSGHFWPIQSRFQIETNKIKPHSQLQIYLWNPEMDEIRIKDFKVQVFGMRYEE